MLMTFDLLRKALRMLDRYPLCSNCLGRQFALLGQGLENNERGEALKLALLLEVMSEDTENSRSMGILKTLATNGFSDATREALHRMKASFQERLFPKDCYLCEGTFKVVDDFKEAALRQLAGCEYSSYLVGVNLPITIEEREDEFKAEFEVAGGETLRNEFGRVLGKKIEENSGKIVDFRKPEVVILVNPFTEDVQLQINPLYVAGRYRKLVRDIPQSKWYCSSCRGKGCEKCDWSGKMYPTSVEEIIEKPFLDATEGTNASFHASGREDIDARMLGDGRPFVVEVSRPLRRFLDLKGLEEAINSTAKGKVQVSGLKVVNRDAVRTVKKGESTQKEYRVTVKFERGISADDMRLVRTKLKNAVVKQRTPVRVSHRRADLTREKYIYDVKVRKLSPRTVEMIVRCQGGLYVKELVTGDEGRTVPSVSEILNNKAKPLKLDVLKVIMDNRAG